MTGTEKHPEVEVAPDVTFNGLWYTVTAPNGNTWSMEDEDKDIPYVEDALYVWSRWLDYVKGASSDSPTES